MLNSLRKTMIKYIRFAAAPTLTAFGAFFALRGEHWMWVYFAIFAIIPKTDYPETLYGDIDRRSPMFNHLFFGHFDLLGPLCPLGLLGLWAFGPSRHGGDA